MPPSGVDCPTLAQTMWSFPESRALCRVLSGRLNWPSPLAFSSSRINDMQHDYQVTTQLTACADNLSASPFITRACGNPDHLPEERTVIQVVNDLRTSSRSFSSMEQSPPISLMVS